VKKTRHMWRKTTATMPCAASGGVAEEHPKVTAYSMSFMLR